MEGTRSAPLSGKVQLEAIFDALALEYVRDRERQVSFISQKRIVIELLGDARGRLLEAGCGPAVMTPELLAMGFETHGGGLSGGVIRRARQRMAGHPLEKRARFARGDVERLQFPEGCFDAVLCMGVLEYLPTYSVALREIARVLKPGGTVVLTVPNHASAYHVMRSSYRNLRRRHATGGDSRPCVPWRLDDELAAAGLRKLESRACNFIFFPLKELHEPLSDSLNRALLPLARTRVAPLLGAQYIVKAKKTAWRSASSA